MKQIRNMQISRRISFALPPYHQVSLKMLHSKAISICFDTICLLLILCILVQSSEATESLLKKKSIVLDSNTPNVFYCSQFKPTQLEKIIVKARPMERLCEFGGKPRPKTEPRDCYNDVDETEFACEEKQRFQMRLDLSREISPNDQSIKDLDFVLTQGNKDWNKLRPLSGPIRPS